MRTPIIDRLPLTFRRWFWDHFQCTATQPAGREVTLYCGRIRWHLGHHDWP